MGLYIAVAVIPALLMVWMMISPKSVWRSFSWQYRSPEVHEPSDAAYTMNRIVAGIGLVAVVVIVGIVSSATSSASESRNRRDFQNQRIEYRECLDRNRDDDEDYLTPEEWCENLSPTPAR